LVNEAFMIGIRRATALLFLSLFFWQYLLTAVLGPEELFHFCLALAACYGVAFMGVAAEWFWARWFAMGLGNFGAIILLLGLLQIGPDPSILIFGIPHLVITAFLAGEGMAAQYEHSEATTERWNFQEESLALMRRAVRSAGFSLPILIIWALGPEADAFALAVLGLAVAGLVGMIRGRTWSVVALGAAGIGAVISGLGLFGHPGVGYLFLDPTGSLVVSGSIFPLLAACLLVVPAIFASPITRYLRSR